MANNAKIYTKRRITEFFLIIAIIVLAIAALFVVNPIFVSQILSSNYITLLLAAIVAAATVGYVYVSYILVAETKQARLEQKRQRDEQNEFEVKNLSQQLYMELAGLCHFFDYYLLRLVRDSDFDRTVDYFSSNFDRMSLVFGFEVSREPKDRFYLAQTLLARELSVETYKAALSKPQLFNQIRAPAEIRDLYEDIIITVNSAKAHLESQTANVLDKGVALKNLGIFQEKLLRIIRSIIDYCVNYPPDSKTRESMNVLYPKLDKALRDRQLWREMSDEDKRKFGKVSDEDKRKFGEMSEDERRRYLANLSTDE